MSFQTKIEWTNRVNQHGKLEAGMTFNPWAGCTKVSAGCRFCYAEARDIRYHEGQHWGKGAPRILHGEGIWRAPHILNKKAKLEGWRPAVFLGSLCDWADEEVDRNWSLRALKTVGQCPHLEWLLLTKRVENATTLLEEAFPAGIPEHVRVGCSLDDQKSLYRVPILRKIPCSHFLSVEPLLEHIDLFPLIQKEDGWQIDQVIVGGESGDGDGIRPMDHAWVESLHNDCWRAGVPFFFKQNGEFAPVEVIQDAQTVAMCKLGRVKQHTFASGNTVYRVGKKNAGNRWLMGDVTKKSIALPASPMRLTKAPCACEACAKERTPSLL